MERYSEYKDSGVQWIGEIPSHWEVLYLFQCLKEYKKSNKDIHHENLLSLSYGKIIQKDINKTEGLLPISFDSYNVISDGNIVLRLTDLQNDHKSLRVGLCKQEGIITSAYLSLVCSSKLIPAYAYLLLHSYDIKKIFYSMGGGLRQSLNYDGLRKLKILVPSETEQKSIIAYLDSQTSRIDSFIADVEREIELLGEAKQTIIADAVTKGLKKDVEMKETNTILSNHIPKHWTVVRNRNLMESHYEPVENRKDITLLSLTLNGVIVRDLSEGKGKFPKDFDKYNVVYPNQIIFCLFDIDETPRTVGLCHNYGMITNAYDTFNIKDNVLPEYLEMYYLAVDNIKGLKPYYTGLRKTVQYNRFIQLRIGIPPIREQQEIVNYISQKTSQIDTLISSLTQQITSLKEYKQRLISDVVTGQINVQNIG